ncbi:MAG TPA: hypothetical protein VN715_01165 [Roseiarcus sp.]|nr:hypothetical protein [Roseiarcus sp.]
MRSYRHTNLRAQVGGNAFVEMRVRVCHTFTRLKFSSPRVYFLSVQGERTNDEGRESQCIQS